MEDKTGNDIHMPTYIRLYREIPPWLEQSPNAFHLLSKFARRARWVEGDWTWDGETIHLLPRQFVTGRKKVSETLGLSESEYRTAYKKLKRYGLIVPIKTTNKYTIAELHADSIFDINLPTDSPSNQPAESPTDNQQIATNNKDNNAKNEVLNNPAESPIKKEEHTEETNPYKDSESYKRYMATRKELGL